MLLQLVTILPYVCHVPTVTRLFPSHHPPVIYSCHPSHHTSPLLVYVFDSFMSSHVLCHHSHMMHVTISSARLFASSLSNCSHIVRQALSTIVAAHFGIVHELSICPVNFYDTLYFILQIIPYMFHPLSIRLSCCMQTFLENTYVPLWFTLV